MNQTDTKVCGMTTNERLFHFNLLQAFDSAALSRDTEKMISLLVQVQFPHSEAEQMVRTILSTPEKYGY